MQNHKLLDKIEGKTGKEIPPRMVRPQQSLSTIKPFFKIASSLLSRDYTRILNFFICVTSSPSKIAAERERLLPAPGLLQISQAIP